MPISYLPIYPACVATRAEICEYDQTLLPPNLTTDLRSSVTLEGADERITEQRMSSTHMDGGSHEAIQTGKPWGCPMSSDFIGHTFN